MAQEPIDARKLAPTEELRANDFVVLAGGSRKPIQADWYGKVPRELFEGLLTFYRPNPPNERSK